jgi:fatty-acyl-CoA synthase
MGVNIGAFLARRAQFQPDKVGLISGDQRLTFDDMNRRANQAARAFAANGVSRGDRVAVLLRNSVEYYDFYFGLARLGAVLVGVNWRLARPEVHYILENSGAKLLFYNAEFGASAGGQLDELTNLQEEVVVGAAAGEGTRTYDGFISGFSDAPLEVVGGDDDPLLLIYTSGTTGLPKGALLTHNQMFWCSTTISHTLDHRQTDVNLLPLPMYHVGGMSFVTTYVHIGSTVVLISAWDTQRVLSLIEREKINHFMAVPSMLKGLLNCPEFDQRDLSSLRWLLASAAPVPIDLIRAYYERGILVLQSYGLSETAGPATVTPKDMAIEKIGSAGLPFFHTEVRLVGLNGEDVRPGDVGEIWIRGPHVISGYWYNEAATRAAMSDGWFRSGDLATQDEDGYITIVDRKKDMIISGGENIYPAELERFLFSHPKLAEVAIIGMTDDQWGETVCAVVVLRDGETLTLDELRAFCDGQIARYKIPRKLIVRKEPLPVNSTGKLLKAELRRQLSEQTEA